MIYHIRLVACALLCLGSALKATEIHIATTPKAGTHLLFKILQLLGVYDASLDMGKIKHHVTHYTNENALTRSQTQNYRFLLQHFSPHERYIVMIRDPRDCLISHVHWLEKQGKELHRYTDANLRAFREWDAQSFDTKLMQGITLNYPDKYSFTRWKWLIDNFFVANTLFKNGQGDKRFLFVRFEDLIGPQGGGDLERQQTALKQIVLFCGLDLTKVDIDALGNEMWAGTTSFRESSSKIAQWPSCFNEQHIAEFNVRYSTLDPIMY